MTNISTRATDWLNAELRESFNVIALAGDASRRRYYRVQTPHQCVVLMDAPPSLEPLDMFIKIAQELRMHGVQAPEVLAANPAEGMLLLTDFGDQLFLNVLNESSADHLYGLALASLGKMRRSRWGEDHSLAPYDHTTLVQEMQLFREWFMRRTLTMDFDTLDQAEWSRVVELLAQSALSQPQVFVHRDYHSRNLMLLANDQVGVLDFQDAVIGPVVYDVVSLLRDCYIDWPDERVSHWLEQYRLQCVDDKLLPGVSLDQFRQWFDFMGLQRHLKCFGIFCRLAKRDDKPNYLQYLPRLKHYVQQVASQYHELQWLHRWINRVSVE